MIFVEWDARPGYGDMTSPCAYVNNLAQKTGESVTLQWRVGRGRNTKDIYEKEDSEDLELRIKTIFDLMKTEDVHLEVTYNYPLSYKHSLLPEHPFHNYRRCAPEHRWVGGGGYVTFCTTKNNKVQFRDYQKWIHKVWKDPTDGDWEPLYSQFDNVRFLDYDKPIKEVIDCLQKTELMISYHGSSASIGRILGTPSFILSGDPHLTLTDFPNALISRRLDFLPDEVSDIQEVCLEKISEAESGIQDYLRS